MKANIGSLYFILLFIYGVLGMNLFGHLPRTDPGMIIGTCVCMCVSFVCVSFACVSFVCVCVCVCECVCVCVCVLCVCVCVCV